MILGMSVATFTLLHVIISLIGIASGLWVAFGMRSAQRMDGMTAIFLITTVLTSVTGFFFHSAKFGPPHIIGVISLAILAATLLARYSFHMSGIWRAVYIVGALLALYLNTFVGVIQSFQKIPALNALAPTQSTEPAFAVAQLIVLAIFIWLGASALKRFHPVAPMATMAAA